MRSPKFFGAPVYLMGGLLIVVPFIDLALALVPTRFSAAAWRFGAEGLVTRTLLTPALGLVIWFVAAWFLDHRVMLRIVAGLAALWSILLALMSVTFALDGLQVRAQVVPAAAKALAVSAAVTLFKNAVFFVSGLVLARSSWKAGRRPSGERDRSTMLIHDTSAPAAPAPTAS